MKMAGGSFDPCIRKDLEETLLCKIRRPEGKQTATHRDFVLGSAMPSAERCDKSVPQHATVVEAGAWTGESASTTG